MMNVDDQPKICVVIRKRPLNKKEIARNQQDIVIVRNGETVVVSEYKQKVDLTKYIEESAFNFDYAFDENSNNDQIYQKAVRPLVQSAFLGARVTCFAYGQTGSGKTFTMNGDLNKTTQGLYVLGAKDIFALQSQKQYNHLKVTVSFFEIYCGRLFDLLKNRNELKLREDSKANIHIVGLEEKPLFSPQEFMQIIDFGSTFRITSQNSTNAESSRSHAILQIALKDGKKIHGKISFIDLAGCERGADHMDQNKQTRIDGAEINKSLLSLKECIRALDQGKGHTPFRGSKLTMVLKDSFVGFCKTVMIGNISPNITSCENTLNTLRYADRVKELKKPNGNEPMSKEDQLAKELMLPRMGKNAVKIMIDSNDDADDIQIKKNEAQKLLGIRNMDDPPPNQMTQSLHSPYNSIQSKDSIPYNQDPYGQQPQQQQQYNQQQQQPYNQYGQQQYGQQQQQSGQFNRLGQQQFNQPPQQQFNQQYNQNQQFSQHQPQQFNSQQFQQAPGQHQNYQFQNQYGQQQPAQLNQPKKMSEDSKFMRKFSMDTGAPLGLTQQSSVGAKKIENTFDTKATIASNTSSANNAYGTAQRGVDPYDLNNSKTVQLRPNSQHQQFQPSQQYGVQNPPNMYGQRPPIAQMQVEPPRTNYAMQQRQPAPQQTFQKAPEVQRPPPNQNQFDWDKVVEQFTNWHPSNEAELTYFRDAHEFLINRLMEEQDSITNQHSTTINKEIETIKEEMKVLGQIEKDRGSYESIEYAEIIENSVDMKLAQLLELKKNVSRFKQHLLEHQECEQKIFMAREELNDDEQLLDNLEDEGNEQRLF